MAALQTADVLDAAVQTLINERCRRAYVHDMRGGLQALYSSVELLVRSARRAVPNAALVEDASAIAKRAMANHENSLLDIVNQVTVQDEASVELNLSELIEEICRFLRNDAASRDLRLESTGSKDLLISAQRNKLRSLIAGLLALSMDALPPGATLQVALMRAGADAALALHGDLTYGEIRSAEQLLCEDPLELQPLDLLLGAARQWLLSHGGRIEIHAVTMPSVLRIYYPLLPA